MNGRMEEGHLKTLKLSEKSTYTNDSEIDKETKHSEEAKDSEERQLHEHFPNNIIHVLSFFTNFI